MEFEYSTFRALVTFLKTWYGLGSLGHFLFFFSFFMRMQKGPFIIFLVPTVLLSVKCISL